MDDPTSALARLEAHYARLLGILPQPKSLSRRRTSFTEVLGLSDRVTAFQLLFRLIKAIQGSDKETVVVLQKQMLKLLLSKYLPLSAPFSCRYMLSQCLIALFTFGDLSGIHLCMDELILLAASTHRNVDVNAVAVFCMGQLLAAFPKEIYAFAGDIVQILSKQIRTTDMSYKEICSATLLQCLSSVNDSRRQTDPVFVQTSLKIIQRVSAEAKSVSRVLSECVASVARIQLTRDIFEQCITIAMKKLDSFEECDAWGKCIGVVLALYASSGVSVETVHWRSKSLVSPNDPKAALCFLKERLDGALKTTRGFHGKYVLAEAIGIALQWFIVESSPLKVVHDDAFPSLGEVIYVLSGIKGENMKKTKKLAGICQNLIHSAFTVRFTQKDQEALLQELLLCILEETIVLHWKIAILNEISYLTLRLGEENALKVYEKLSPKALYPLIAHENHLIHFSASKLISSISQALPLQVSPILVDLHSKSAIFISEITMQSGEPSLRALQHYFSVIIEILDCNQCTPVPWMLLGDFMSTSRMLLSICKEVPHTSAAVLVASAWKLMAALIRNYPQWMSTQLRLLFELFQTALGDTAAEDSSNRSWAMYALSEFICAFKDRIENEPILLKPVLLYLSSALDVLSALDSSKDMTVDMQRLEQYVMLSFSQLSVDLYKPKFIPLVHLAVSQIAHKHCIGSVLVNNEEPSISSASMEDAAISLFIKLFPHQAVKHQNQLISHFLQIAKQLIPKESRFKPALLNLAFTVHQSLVHSSFVAEDALGFLLMTSKDPKVQSLGADVVMASAAASVSPIDSIGSALNKAQNKFGDRGGPPAIALCAFAVSVSKYSIDTLLGPIFMIFKESLSFDHIKVRQTVFDSLSLVLGNIEVGPDRQEEVLQMVLKDLCADHEEYCDYSKVIQFMPDSSKGSVQLFHPVTTSIAISDDLYAVIDAAFVAEDDSVIEKAVQMFDSQKEHCDVLQWFGDIQCVVLDLSRNEDLNEEEEDVQVKWRPFTKCIALDNLGLIMNRMPSSVLRDLIRLLCRVSASPLFKVQKKGLELLTSAIEVFRCTADPANESKLFLTLFQAELTTAAKGALADSCLPAVRAIGIDLMTKLITCGIVTDAVSVKRFIQALLHVTEFRQSKWIDLFASFVLTESVLQSAVAMARFLDSSATKQTVKAMKDFVGNVMECHCNVLEDFTALSQVHWKSLRGYSGHYFEGIEAPEVVDQYIQSVPVLLSCVARNLGEEKIGLVKGVCVFLLSEIADGTDCFDKTDSGMIMDALGFSIREGDDISGILSLGCNIRHILSTQHITTLLRHLIPFSSLSHLETIMSLLAEIHRENPPVQLIECIALIMKKSKDQAVHLVLAKTAVDIIQESTDTAVIAKAGQVLSLMRKSESILPFIESQLLHLTASCDASALELVLSKFRPLSNVMLQRLVNSKDADKRTIGFAVMQCTVNQIPVIVKGIDRSETREETVAVMRALSSTLEKVNESEKELLLRIVQRVLLQYCDGTDNTKKSSAVESMLQLASIYPEIFKVSFSSHPQHLQKAFQHCLQNRFEEPKPQKKKKRKPRKAKETAVF